MSVKVFDTILDDQPYLGEHLSEDDQRRVKDMILASCPGRSKTIPSLPVSRAVTHTWIASYRPRHPAG